MAPWLAWHGSGHQLVSLCMTLRLCAERWRPVKQGTDDSTRKRSLITPFLYSSSFLITENNWLVHLQACIVFIHDELLWLEIEALMLGGAGGQNLGQKLKMRLVFKGKWLSRFIILIRLLFRLFGDTQSQLRLHSPVLYSKSHESVNACVLILMSSAVIHDKFSISVVWTCLLFMVSS